MKNKLKYIILLISIITVSCAAPEKKIITQPVENSKMHNGRAVITEITDSKSETETVNTGYVDIYFKFIPSDPEGVKNYLCHECADSRIKLFYDNRDSFHKNWVDKWDIKPGSEYRAIRHELGRKDNTTGVSFEVFLEPKK